MGLAAGGMWTGLWLWTVWLSWTGPEGLLWLPLAAEILLAACLLSGEGMAGRLAWAAGAGLLGNILARRGGLLILMLNRAFPGYGRFSAGGGFAVMLLTGGFALGSLLAIPAAFALRALRGSRRSEKKGE